MNRTKLDEMQLQKRNMIGNQAFMLLFYLLLIDIGLNGFGFYWLQYPMNVFVIMQGCMAYYLIRLIWHNSYVGPKTNVKSIGRNIGLVIGIAVSVAGIAVYLGQDSLNVSNSNGGDSGGMILFVSSIILFIMLAVISLISKWQAKSDE